ncbi:Uncharacterised protein [Mycobacterium tuberculosis]|nr:Uncharacterised protein [Mycobacterium tuberculosis]
MSHVTWVLRSSRTASRNSSLMTSQPGASAPAGQMPEPAFSVLRYMRKYDSSASFGSRSRAASQSLKPWVAERITAMPSASLLGKW